MADEKTIYLIDPERLTRPAQPTDAEIFARTLADLKRSRDYWQTRAMLAEAELLLIRQGDKPVSTGDVCPVCHKPPILVCRCLLGERKCERGHLWTLKKDGRTTRVTKEQVTFAHKQSAGDNNGR